MSQIQRVHVSWTVRYIALSWCSTSAPFTNGVGNEGVQLIGKCLYGWIIGSFKTVSIYYVGLDEFETYLQGHRSSIPGIHKSSSQYQKQSSAFPQDTFHCMKKGCQYWQMNRRAYTIDSFGMAVVEYSKDFLNR